MREWLRIRGSEQWKVNSRQTSEVFKTSEVFALIITLIFFFLVYFPYTARIHAMCIIHYPPPTASSTQLHSQRIRVDPFLVQHNAVASQFFGTVQGAVGSQKNILTV